MIGCAMGERGAAGAVGCWAIDGRAIDTAATIVPTKMIARSCFEAAKHRPFIESTPLPWDVACSETQTGQGK